MLSVKKIIYSINEMENSHFGPVLLLSGSIACIAGVQRGGVGEERENSDTG